MDYIYSERDQKAIDESMQRIKEHDELIISIIKRCNLTPEQQQKEFVNNKDRQAMLKVHTDLVATRIPIGLVTQK